MSKCFYIKCEDGFVNLEAVKDAIQEMMNKDLTVRLEEFEKSEGEGGLLYIENESIRGIQVFKEDNNIVVRINTLSNYPDFILAKVILYVLNQALKKDVADEDDKVIEPKDYFTDEKIQEIREQDAETIYKMLMMARATKQDFIHIPGIVRITYFGKTILEELSKYKNDSKTMVKIFETVMNHVQYGLPDFNMPGAALISPQNSENDADFKTIRMMFEGNGYILQDYDYLMIQGNKDEAIFIDNNDLIEICCQIYKKDSDFELADDLTVVFPKLEGKNWNKFVELAREKNHKEILECVPAAKSINLTPDYTPDEEDENHTSYQCHGDHWDCVFLDTEKEFAATIQTAIQEGNLVGSIETDFTLEENEEKNYGKVFELEYSKNQNDSLTVRIIIASVNDANQVVSMYPAVREGILWLSGFLAE